MWGLRKGGCGSEASAKNREKRCQVPFISKLPRLNLGTRLMCVEIVEVRLLHLGGCGSEASAKI